MCSSLLQGEMRVGPCWHSKIVGFGCIKLLSLLICFECRTPPLLQMWTLFMQNYLSRRLMRKWSNCSNCMWCLDVSDSIEWYRVVSSAAVSQVWAACGAMPWSSLPTKPQRSQRSQRVLEGLMDPDGSWWILMAGAQLGVAGVALLRTFSWFPATGFMPPWPQLASAGQPTASCSWPISSLYLYISLTLTLFMILYDSLWFFMILYAHFTFITFIIHL